MEAGNCSLGRGDNMCKGPEAGMSNTNKAGKYSEEEPGGLVFILKGGTPG